MIMTCSETAWHISLYINPGEILEIIPFYYESDEKKTCLMPEKVHKNGSSVGVSFS